LTLRVFCEGLAVGWKTEIEFWEQDFTDRLYHPVIRETKLQGHTVSPNQYLYPQIKLAI